jgi:LytS/YehU family sensor histidine kinase
MRASIKKLKLLERALNTQLVGFILVSFVFATLVGLLETYLTVLFNIGFKDEVKLNGLQKISANVFTSFIYLFIWNSIYFIYHYIAESRRQQVDKLKLEALVKTLELKTIKAHINPHFIFNALNSIRALIDENPGRARQAVTALGNMLRSSMYSDQQETIPLEKELKIVEDYLALEQIRFEDRLVLVYDVAPETLSNPIPPMMLQMLVENAIKHGINKSVKGGEVKITAENKNNFFNLVVQNIGTLDRTMNLEGFGLQSTESRLELLFGAAAQFSITELDGPLVEAKITIPLK